MLETVLFLVIGLLIGYWGVGHFMVAGKAV